MPLRRLTTSLGFGALSAAVIGACLPWSVALPDLQRFVARELAKAYGIVLHAEDPVEIALLPLPRFSFHGVRLTAGTREGPVLSEGGSLSLQLNVLPLLTGRIDVNTLALDGATIRLPTDAGDRRWAEPVRLLEERLAADGASHPRRISLSRATATGGDPRDGTPQTARDLDLSLSWPLWSAQADLAGRFSWNSVPARFSAVGLRPINLLSGGTSPFSLTASWAAGSLAAEGNGRIGTGRVRLTGRGTFETRSLPETLAWAGGTAALTPFVEAFGLDGSFELDGRQLLLPNVRVMLGSNRLEGAGSVAFDRDRPTIQATLAAESLNFAPLVVSGLRMLGLDPSETAGDDWRTRTLALAPLTGGDLDLRLSAGAARFGPVLAEDVAASLLVRSGKLEAALNRASLTAGNLKGRLALTASAADPAVTEMKAQGVFEGVNLAALLVTLGQESWVAGRGQGQFVAESSGSTSEALLGHVGGHATLSVDGGTLAGVDLTEAVLRHGTAARRAARTAFERATLSLRFADGIGQITEGTLEGQALSASLRGRVFLPDRRGEAVADVAARVSLAEGIREKAARFLIGGPLTDLAVHVVTRDSDPALRGGALLAPNGLRLPAAARAYAP